VERCRRFRKEAEESGRLGPTLVELWWRLGIPESIDRESVRNEGGPATPCDGTGCYILVDGQPVRVDWTVWGPWFENPDNRRVRETEVGEVVVSTIFVGVDTHHRRQGPPQLWETIVFAPGRSDYKERHSSHEDALGRHDALVEIARAGRLAELD
jgi:hypothetical protein